MQFNYPKQWMNNYDGWEGWTENLSKYECGIYFAVHLGDVLGNGRYKVLHKLGNGSFSQVWLAKDQFPGGHSYVALKIVQANTTEAQILKYLAQCPHDHPGSNHVMKLLDHFVIEATNGSYDGLVLEIVGLSTFRALENSLYGKLSGSRARRASVQAAMGLAYMHQLKVGHGDLHAGNVCFAALNVNNLSEAQIMSHLGPPYLLTVKRRDGKAILPSVPRHTVRPSPFTQAGDVIKIIDLGQAFFFDRKPERIITPDNVKAPELLFSANSLSWDYRIDLWALGCLFYELFVGKPAFNSLSPKTLGWEMTRAIREVPQCWQPHFNPKEFLNPNGLYFAFADLQPALVLVQNLTLAPGSPKEIYEGLRSLEENLRADYDFLGGDMTHKELKHLAALLRELLVLEPGNRKSASQIIDYPWLCGH